MNAERAAALLEANEQLVLAVMRAHDENQRSALRATYRAPPRESQHEGPLFERVVQALTVAQRAGERLGLLFVSLDNLAEIEDMVGHARGADIAQLAAARVAGALRASDSVSRYSSHELLVMLSALSQPSDALTLAHSIVATLAMPVPVALGLPAIYIKSSVGISVFPDDGNDGHALIDRATAAMYHARGAGLGGFYFRGEPGTGERSLELRKEESLRQRISIPAGGGASGDLVEQQRDANEQLLLSAMRTHQLLAAAELAQRRQTEFMGVVAHELRGPLGPLGMASALLGHVKTDAPALAMARGVIDRQVSRMGHLVDDLLDVARVTTGKLRLDMRRLDAVQLIREAAEGMRATIVARGQNLHLDLPDAPLMIHGDSLRLSQIVVNLLGNACKYTEPGGNVSVSVIAGGAALTLSVVDDGIGISTQALTQVFERFVQEDHAAAYDGSGLGIGLSLVRELVLAHGGLVVAASAGPGLGSRFTVTLPLVRPAA